MASRPLSWALSVACRSPTLSRCSMALRSANCTASFLVASACMMGCSSSTGSQPQRVCSISSVCWVVSSCSSRASCCNRRRRSIRLASRARLGNVSVPTALPGSPDVATSPGPCTAKHSVKPAGRGRLPCSDSVSVAGDTCQISASSRKDMPVCRRMVSEIRLGLAMARRFVNGFAVNRFSFTGIVFTKAIESFFG